MEVPERGYDGAVDETGEPNASVSDDETLRVLHVDDDPAFCALTSELLTRQDDRFEVTAAQNTRDGLDLLAASTFDAIVSDYEMSHRDGIEFLRAVRERGFDEPFVLFTGNGSEGVASEAIAAGVTDYLRKESGVDQFVVLANRIENAVAQHRAAADRRRRTEQYEAVASLGRFALETEALDPLFEWAVTALTARLGADYAKILERRPDETLALVAGRGWPDGVVGSATVPANDDSQAGYTLGQADPVVVTDLATEERFGGPALLTDHGVVSGISVVIGPSSDPWGVLGTHTVAATTFSEQDVTFVRNVANVLAAAVEQHTVQERLRESETRFREIAELSPDGIFRADPTGTFRYVSPRAAEMLGRPVEEIEGTNFGSYVTDDCRQAALEEYQRVLDGEVIRALELTVVDGDGEEMHVEVSASPVVEDGDVVVVQGFARDVTDRRERERELHLRREQYRTLVDHFPNGGVFRFDEDLKCVLAGGQELARVGLTAEAVVGSRPSDIFPPDIAAELEANYRAALAGETNTFDQTYQGNSYQVRTVPIRDATGDVDGGMAVSLNVTEQVERERRLREQNERLDELARIVSHDLRNPLDVAINRLELAREEVDSEHFAAIERAHDRIEALVDDLLAAAVDGHRKVETETVPLGEFVDDCWATVATAGGRLVVETDRSVRADPGQLRRLVENLLGNAVRHGGDEVTVTVGDLDDGFYVADDGPGVPADERERVFETGHTTASEGTGLGLYIVQTIAAEHGWDIALTESADGGARFEVRTDAP
jgi:PAS domain S-box-containing protein